MTIRKQYTPEVLLSAPRRSAAIPSPDGKLALFTQSSYSFQTHARTSEIRALDLTQGTETTISKDAKASEPRWLGTAYEVVWLKETENGNTNLVVTDATLPGKSYTAGTVPGPVSSLKLHVIQPGKVAIAVAGQANPDGNLFNPKDAPKSHTSARVYDSLFVRHWDSWVTEQRNALFTALLQKAQPVVTSRQGRYSLHGFKNALQGTNLECPIPPFGGVDHFDIGPTGLVIVAKDPLLDPATHTKCDAWFVPKKDLMDVSPTSFHKLHLPGLDGAASCPVFSPNGQSMAFLQMAADGYESDKNRIVLVQGLNGVERGESASVFELMRTPDGQGGWDRSPTALKWSPDGNMLLLEAEDTGRGCLFALDLNAAPSPEWRPRQLTHSGYIIDFAPLSTMSNLLIVSSNNLVDNSVYTLVNPDPLLVEPQAPVVISSLSRNGSMFGLSPEQVSSIWWKGANDHPVHAWMMRPSFFRADQTYPLAYLIHGGPQGAWNDQWSTRWNPAVFAEQGYVVVCPNPTGSTGYGQAFTDAIRNQWGGLPYEDLVKGFEYIRAELPFVDTARSVALGASYGGYMMNWMQGHALGRQFKALVCHDGVFSMTGQLASEEQYFPVHDLGGPLWKRQEVYDRWDPSRFLTHWDTPMLVIHNELDFRLTISEGLSAFNVLQMRGVESRFLSFPDENHWVLKPENSLVWHLVVINWINRFVGLPKIVDRQGRDGSGFCRRESRRVWPKRQGSSKLEQ
ncbi:Dipeptidyl-peptidase 5 [Cladophialophora carrionii]|uniref:Dipeptidyl-peptidase V n=1 Tax=Cladophialophora carrionii TaxID=86049 RepID=A0A1C1CR21_9EURO|nr:Dipeptidyl-peptidase 5 [Cladophialophora carrionii]